ncbi:MAG: hypothetical protein CMF49_06435 [Legionellales bacterium]|nr:hypothetical protein [Legionellales bacterium]
MTCAINCVISDVKHIPAAVVKLRVNRTGNPFVAKRNFCANPCGLLKFPVASFIVARVCLLELYCENAVSIAETNAAVIPFIL